LANEENEEDNPSVEQRLKHLEEMVELFGKHTETHIRSTVDVHGQLDGIKAQVLALYKQHVEQQEMIVKILSLLPPPKSS
jgi:succinylglutamate desuccinylase